MISNCFSSKTTILYKAFYFVFYAGYISFLLYVPVYFKYLGLSAIYVGLLNGIRPLMQTVGAPLWGVIGDRFRIRKIIFIFAFIVMTVKTMMFFVFRPGSTMCVVTYYNTSSKNIIRNETYVVKHNIIKRWANPNEATMLFFNQNTDILKQGGLNTLTSPKHFDIVNKGFTEMSNDMSIERKTRSKRDALGYEHSLADERIIVKNYRDYSVHYKIAYDDEESTRIFFWILLLVICGDAFDAAVFTLADTSCLDTLGSENYGYYRLWGSAGWGIMSPVIGFAITHITRDYCGTKAGSYFIIFYFYLGFMYLGLLFGSHFEFSYNHNDHVHQTVKSALLNFHYGIFLFVTFYAGVCYGFLLYFVNWFIDGLGGTAIVMGTATACKSIMDVLGFFLAGRIIDTLGHLNTVTISLIAYIGAFISYSYITEPWYAVPIEVLHAGAYALVWSASVSYLNKAAPAGSSATVQGILQGVYWGLGTGGGTIVGGYVSYVFGFRSTFRGFAVVTAVVLTMFLTTQLVTKYSELYQDDRNEESDEMYSSPEKLDKKSYSDDDDSARETWTEKWKTPPASQPVISSQPTDLSQAEDFSLTGNVREPASVSDEHADSTQSPVLVEESESQPEGHSDKLDNTSEQTPYDDSMKLIDES